MKVTPRPEHVVIERLTKGELRKKNGILLPDDMEGVPNVGRVVSIGSGVQELHEGQRVFYYSVLGKEVPTEEGVHVFLHQEDIIAVIEE